MKNFRNPAPFFAALLLVLLAGCATAPGPVIKRGADPLAQPHAGVVGQSAATEADGIEAVPAEAPRPQITTGTGNVINRGIAAQSAPSLDAPGEATFNFEGESLHAVVKAILGDLLQQNYVIAPGVQGQVTLATPRPVNAAQAMSLLEMVLGWNNARLVWSDGRYNVLPTEQAIPGNLSPRTGGVSDTRGYEVRAVPLQYISANEMKKILEPYARPNSIVSVDGARNMITLAGTRAELENYLRTVSIFDVDWLSGMSVGVFPLLSAEADAVVDELEGVFGEAGNTPISGMFRFMPLLGQNAVMVITAQPKYLRQVQGWIEKLDAGGGETARLYTYEVLYMKAPDLADQLSQVFGGGGGGGDQGSYDEGASLMPGLEPVEMRSIDTPAADAASPKARAEHADNEASARNSGGDGIAVGNSDDVSISAVEESNALLVRATPIQWESIRRTIERLDTMPLQVHIEAQVIEVKLTGELKYGVDWFFRYNYFPALLRNRGEGGSMVGSGDSPTGGVWNFVGDNNAAIVTLLDNASDVRILSTPSVLVRNNAEATLDVGTKIPVNSTSFNPINGGDSADGTYSQVQYLDTGVILKVKPRISRDGTVFMEIDQEVSSPGRIGAGGNREVDSRSLVTEAAIKSGETVLLAGLIIDNTSKGSSGLPGLSRIPVIGGLFGTQSDFSDRSEVIILVTPTVIRDPNEARRMTDEYGERFRALDPLRAKPVTEPRIN